MKKLALVAFVALLAVSFAYAAETPAKAAPQTGTSTAPPSHTTHPSALTHVKGTIDKIDATAKTITLTVGTESKTLTYNDKTQVYANHKRVKIDALKQGDKVSVTRDSKDIIRSIAVEPAAAPAK